MIVGGGGELAAAGRANDEAFTKEEGLDVVDEGWELPADVDRSGIRARYRAGMLWVTLPRTGGARSETDDE